MNPLAPALGGLEWDVFWIISDPAPGRVWELPLRAVVKPFAGAEDVLRKYGGAAHSGAGGANYDSSKRPDHGSHPWSDRRQDDRRHPTKS